MMGMLEASHHISVLLIFNSQPIAALNKYGVLRYRMWMLVK
ncbi:hypothetical protein K08M4_13080 [Vibrio syngnathi]|uniref:Uncharacterized protein n=1 Tax=Vibrio syngnathi TaxID=3034029 RepID=A0AA34TNH9_9VIBR|nr:hypothetical protein K08M4_13080 [Vibrio syngnathi]